MAKPIRSTLAVAAARASRSNARASNLTTLRSWSAFAMRSRTSRFSIPVTFVKADSNSVMPASERSRRRIRAFTFAVGCAPIRFGAYCAYRAGDGTTPPNGDPGSSMNHGERMMPTIVASIAGPVGTPSSSSSICSGVYSRSVRWSPTPRWKCLAKFVDTTTSSTRVGSGTRPSIMWGVSIVRQTWSSAGGKVPTPPVNASSPRPSTPNPFTTNAVTASTSGIDRTTFQSNTPRLSSTATVAGLLPSSNRSTDVAPRRAPATAVDTPAVANAISTSRPSRARQRLRHSARNQSATALTPSPG